MVVVFAVRYVQLFAGLASFFADDASKLKPQQIVFSPESAYFLFILDLIKLLDNLLLPKKRNEYFFRGFESTIDEKHSTIRVKTLKNAGAKFYRYSFGKESFESIHEIGPKFIANDNGAAEMLVYKEELVNFNDDCFDYILDLKEESESEAFSDSIKFERKKFSNYFFEYFFSKNGVQILLDSVSCKFKFAQNLHDCLIMEEYKEQNKRRFLNANYVLTILQLVNDLLKNLKKSYSSNYEIKIDQNFTKSKKTNQHLEYKSIQVKDYLIEYSTKLMQVGFGYIAYFNLDNSFNNEIIDVVNVVFFIQSVWKEFGANKKLKEPMQQIETQITTQKIEKQYFLKQVIRIIKLYLSNPNYSQKMQVASFLNSLENQVPP